MSIERRRPRGALRRLERWFVGLTMALVALVLERIVLRSVRSRGGAPPQGERTITSRGAEVEG